MSDPITDEQRAQLLAAMGAPMPAAPPSLAANPLAQMAPPVPPPSVNPVPAAPVPAAPASPVATPAEVARHQARTDKAYEAATTNHWMDQMPEGAVEDVQLANAGTSYAPSTKTGHLEPHKIRQPVSFVRDNAPSPVWATQPAGSPEPGVAGGGTPAPYFQHRYSPEARKAYEDAFAAEQGAVGKDRLMGGIISSIAEDTHKQNEQEIRAFGEKQAKAEADRQAEARDRLAEYEQERKRYAAMGVDPSHFWKTRTAGQTAMLLLGQALSNFGAAFSGHPELVNQQLNAMIDRDIDAQKANIAKAHNALNAKSNLVSQMYARFGDERAAAAAARGIMVDSMAERAQELAAATGNATAIARAEKMSADLKMQQAEYLAREMGLVQPKGGAGAGGLALTKSEEEQARWLSDQYKAMDIPASEASARTVQNELSQPNADEGIGLGANIVKGIPVVGAPLYGWIYGADARQRDQDWAHFKNQIIHSFAGSSMSDNERAAAKEELDAASTAAERRTAVARALQRLHEKAAVARAGVSPNVATTWDVRRDVNAPPQATPSGQSFTLQPPTMPAKK